MARYVDGFVLVVPKNKLEEYKKMAELGCRVWMKHGAIDYKECVGDDLMPQMPEDMPPGMEMGNFVKLTNLKEDEVVVFSYITYESKAHRDEVNAKVMTDPEMAECEGDQVFEMSKMNFGGFEVLVDGK